MAEGIGMLPTCHWRNARIRALDDGQTLRRCSSGCSWTVRTPVKREARA